MRGEERRGEERRGDRRSSSLDQFKDGRTIHFPNASSLLVHKFCDGSRLDTIFC